MSDDRIRVLAIAGAPRSGTTILTSILGESEGFLAAGEVNHYWRNAIKNRHCACRERLSDCPLWGPLGKMLEELDPPLQTKEMHRRRDELNVARLAVSVVRSALPHRLRPYVETLGTLYAALAETTGDRVIVDSSKNPQYFHLLGHAKNLDVRIVHIVRDPRGVAFSRRRRTLAASAAGTALLWDARNAAAEMLWRGGPAYKRVRYEDFVSNPRGTVADLLAHAGEPEAEPAVQDNGKVTLSGNHIIAGNRNRKRRGETRVRLDDAWEDRLAGPQRAVVTTLASPFLLRYGYPLVASNNGDGRARKAPVKKSARKKSARKRR